MTTSNNNITRIDILVITLDPISTNPRLQRHTVELRITLTSTANTAVGNEALKAAAGNFNTAVGFYALRANTAANNVAVGVNALLSNTSGTGNTAVGTNAGRASTTNSYSTSIGYQSNISATGASNTSVGSGSGANLTSGGNNTFVGVNAGMGITTGSHNTMIGFPAVNSPASRSNWVQLFDGYGNTAFTRDSLNRVGLGTINTPAALLHIAAGTTSIAPIRLTSGTNLTTPVAGSNVTITGTYPTLTIASSGGSSGWGLTGNATTFPNTYLGTTGSATIRFITNNVQRMRIDSIGRTFVDSTYFGRGTGTNYNNVAIGDSTLLRNTTGNGLTVIGDSALRLNTSGFDNTAIGNKAGAAITTTGGNTLVGSNVGLTLTSTANTAVGNEALKAAAGNFNTAVGFRALMANTAANNVAVGVNALLSNTSGTGNTAVGTNAGQERYEEVCSET